MAAKVTTEDEAAAGSGGRAGGGGGGGGGNGRSGGEEASPVKEVSMEADVWHALAGPLVHVPDVGADVFYFPQAHEEQAIGYPYCIEDRSEEPPLPSAIPCRVKSRGLYADPATDEVFARITLVPCEHATTSPGRADPSHDIEDARGHPPLVSIAKVLTPSDVSTCGGFSVPRTIADTCLPPLDYSEHPPAQAITARDVHNEEWPFRHIYRGTPKRHLFTTGWGAFATAKKLVAGDAIIFVRMRDGSLRLGIRRSHRNSQTAHSPPGTVDVRHTAANELRNMRANNNGNDAKPPAANGNSATTNNSVSGGKGPNSRRGPGIPSSSRQPLEIVLAAARAAASGQTFTVEYHPTAGGSAGPILLRSRVAGAAQQQWSVGQRFKIACKSEDFGVYWCTGTIAGVSDAWPTRWANSLWRCLQVRWDDPDMRDYEHSGQLPRVSPWDIEQVDSTFIADSAPLMTRKRHWEAMDFVGSADTPAIQYGKPHLAHSHHHHGPRASASTSPPRYHDYKQAPPRTLPLLPSPFEAPPPPPQPPSKRPAAFAPSPAPSKLFGVVLKPAGEAVGAPVNDEPHANNSHASRITTAGSALLAAADLASAQLEPPALPQQQQQPSSMWRPELARMGVGIGHPRSAVWPTRVAFADPHSPYNVGVFKNGSGVGRLVDLKRITSYTQLEDEVAQLFKLGKNEYRDSEGRLHMVYEDRDGDTMLIEGGPAPWSMFLSSAQRIHLLPPENSMKADGRDCVAASSLLPLLYVHIRLPLRQEKTLFPQGE
eukprot:jgi/Chlat1/2003/Chrsp158S02297